ncbi:hypothetical protein N7492_006335 [Penicillium capsulatum]|uniref:PHD-type domain-containing protein n=1 Tax=Penicillium capsulatum TaxID=69766 RepID=A0A9W9I3W5_9EURO|nr:hypothetical protein N7492_006335 [Penicillium capsulatum]
MAPNTDRNIVLRASRAGGTKAAVPPTAMGCADRASRQVHSEPAKTATPHPLYSKIPRPKRAIRAQGHAPVIEATVEPIQSTWEEPRVARACPTWLDADSKSAQYHEVLKTMKPLGQYPSPAEYKSVGLRPPSRQVLKQALLASCAEIDDADLMTDTPLTPVADDAISPDATCPDEDQGVQSTVASKSRARREKGGNGDDKPPTGDMNTALGMKAASALNGRLNGTLHLRVNRSLDPDSDGNLEGSLKSTYKSSMMEPTLDPPLDSPLDTSPATPVSNAVAPTAQPSVSPAETPVGELTSHLTFPSLPCHPETPPVTAVVDNMASQPEEVAGPDFLAVLETLPSPTSAIYDVAQLKGVVENAVRHSSGRGEHDVALSLVHYWSRANGDDFKLSLIHNLGREEADHSLELALRTMLRSSVEDASEWLKTNFPSSNLDSGSDSSLSSAKSPNPQPSSRTSFKVADIYRDTSGPKLEEAFVNGKTNTAPLKRPKRPCPVNENPYKRHLEWDADPSMSENLQNKRLCLSEQTSMESPEAQESSVRSVRSVRSESPDTSDAEPVSVFPRPKSNSPRVLRNPEEQRLERIRWRQDWTIKVQASKKKSRSRSRSSGKPLTIGWDPQTSDSAYSERENDWDSSYERRRDPESIEPPENVDNCTICDGGGELLCCDTCEYAFHFRCLKPAIDPKKAPKGAWFCPRCEPQISFTRAIRQGEFGTRKTEYTPPTDIKNYFLGVGEVIDRGSRIYKEIPHLPRLTKPPKKGTPAVAINDPSLLKLWENGQLLRCTKCGLTTLQTRPMIRCDYCTCRWHLDCLDPPVPRPLPIPRLTAGCVRTMFVIDGRVQERRVRRPKNTVSDVDIDILTSDDPKETSFDDDWREKRFRLPAGDVIMSFISAVHEDARRREQRYYGRIQKTAVDVARRLTFEHFYVGPHTPASPPLPAPLERNITAAIEGMKSGHVSSEQYDAASALLGLSQSHPRAAVGDQTATDPPQPHSLDTNSEESATVEASESVLSPRADTASAIGVSQPAIEADARPEAGISQTAPRARLPASRPSSTPRRTPALAPETSKSDTDVPSRTRASARKKRSRNESLASTANEPAQKRRHTDSD